MKTTILLAMLLTACGAENYQAPTTLAPKAAQTEPVQSAPTQPEAQRALVAAQAAPAEQNVAASARPALAVAGMADLPLCNVNDEGWIIYVQAEKSLQACLGGDWQPVDVRGAQGAAGAQGEPGKDGAAGAKGDTGAAGAQGIAGVKGERGSDGFPVAGDTFIDPDTGISWLIVSGSATYAQAVCPTGMSVPVTGGLRQKFIDHFVVYFSTLAGDLSYWADPMLGAHGASPLDASDTGTHLLICTRS